MFSYEYRGMSTILHKCEFVKLTAVNTQVKLVSDEVQDVNSNLDDVKRSSSLPSLLNIEHLTRTHGTNYGRA